MSKLFLCACVLFLLGCEKYDRDEFDESQDRYFIRYYEKTITKVRYPDGVLKRQTWDDGTFHAYNPGGKLIKTYYPDSGKTTIYEHNENGDYVKKIVYDANGKITETTIKK